MTTAVETIRVGELDAWVTGLRRNQAETRTGLRKGEADPGRPGLVKVNPLADWSWEQLWAYIREHDVPYDRLHERGYPSIGCAPCTRAVGLGGDLRAGRWWWETAAGPKECGLHVASARPAAGGRS
jgi:phosphoadenosine phosphosulfate reductase